MDLIKTIEEQQKKDYQEQIQVGDTVKVYFKIVEGGKERIQVYEGLVICMKNAGVRKTFTVRKISYGVGVERVFPINSPRIEKIEILRRGKVRRAKLYYIREKVGKGTRIKEQLGAKVTAEIQAANAASAKAAEDARAKAAAANAAPSEAADAPAAEE